MKRHKLRVAITVLAVAGLSGFYILQDVNLAFLFFSVEEPLTAFFINRSIRFLTNDFLAIMLIYGLFGERKYVHFAVMVQVFGFVFLLLPYFIFKLYWPQYNGPMISFLHRIILNPTLMLLLIPALYYQKRIEKK